MKVSTGIAITVAGILGAVVLSRGFVANGRNADERKQHWETVISTSIKPGTSVDELKEFAQNNAVKLDCYQNYQKEHRCSFNDPLSIGGTTSRPTQLTVIFKVQDSTVVSHEFTQTQAVNK
jgi:hypothetical protein